MSFDFVVDGRVKFDMFLTLSYDSSSFVSEQYARPHVRGGGVSTDGIVLLALQPNFDAFFYMVSRLFSFKSFELVLPVLLSLNVCV